MPSYSNYPSGFTQAFCSMLVSNIHMKCVLHITLEQQQRRRRRQSSGERGRSEPEKNGSTEDRKRNGLCNIFVKYRWKMYFNMIKIQVGTNEHVSDLS